MTDDPKKHLGHKTIDREEYARLRERAAREGGGPEAQRQLELGPQAALAELFAV